MAACIAAKPLLHARLQRNLAERARRRLADEPRVRRRALHNRAEADDRVVPA